jgi:hypothetical protein
MKRKIIVFIALVLVLTIITPLRNANASEINPRWTYIRSMTAGLDVSILGIATCNGQFAAYENVPVEIIMHLKQLKNGSWGTLRTWSTTGTCALNVEKQYAVEHGYTYKVVVTGYVYDANGNILETASASKSFVY